MLQAIARVNRLFDGKEFGYIVDYRGVLGELNEAMNLYDALAEFDAEDIEGTFADVSEEIAKLPQRHSDLWAIFEPVANKKDREAMERFLEPEDRRQRFYEALTDYARSLRVALASVQFYEETPEARINRYKDDLKFFHRLRSAIKLRYAESVDYREYEEKVRKLMDRARARHRHQRPSRPWSTSSTWRAFDAEVEKLGTPTAKADTILNRMKRTITERMDEDPAFYRRFSELVEETILAYKQGRIDQLEYLRQAEAHLDDHAQWPQRWPAVAADPLPARAGLLWRHARVAGTPMAWTTNSIADSPSARRQIIEAHKVTDWENNHDVKQQIRRDLDELFYEVEQATGIEIELDETDLIIDRVLEVAKARSRKR